MASAVQGGRVARVEDLVADEVVSRAHLAVQVGLHRGFLPVFLCFSLTYSTPL